MRIYWGMLAVSLCLLGGAGICFWKNVSVAGAKDDFFRWHAPVREFSPAAMATTRASSELADVALALPFTHLFPPDEISALYRYAETCGEPPKLKTRMLQKALHWHRYVCGQAALPAYFFEHAPFLHPSGKSFARLAGKTGDPAFSTFLHLLETPGFPFTRSEWQALVEERDGVVTASEIYFLVPQNGWLETKYAVYPLRQWQDFEARAQSWSRRFADLGNALLTVSSLLTLLTLLFLAYEKIRDAKGEKEARLFVLQTLTHELRTPATTLKLTLEEFRSEFDLLPEKAQLGFLRMCDEVQRLSRIIEASTQYLRASEDRTLLQFRYSDIESINEFVERLLESYPDVTWTPLARDSAFRADRYWVGTCVKNLVENALHHGKAPVEVRLDREGDLLKVQVQDAGRFDETTPPRGLGLGLAIVRKIVRLMEGTLEFQPNPTRFALSLRSAP